MIETIDELKERLQSIGCTISSYSYGDDDIIVLLLGNNLSIYSRVAQESYSLILNRISEIQKTEPVGDSKIKEILLDELHDNLIYSN